MSDALTIEAITALSQVSAADWDALSDPNDPFTEHAFLSWLEESGCVGEGTGWSPAHVLAWRGQGADRVLAGRAPAYVKSNSYGEFIFDWGWADACRRAGIAYYPKVTCAVPFTPATGPRLAVRPGEDEDAVRASLAGALRAVADKVGASSAHVLFPREEELPALVARGYQARRTHQYHWTDRGFGDFEGWLTALTTKRRKEVRRERRAAQAAGLTLAVERASALSDDDLIALHACYVSTYEDKWGKPYLTAPWFAGLRDRLGDRAVIATARRDGRMVAGALAFTKGAHVYGRNWGALEPVPALHFELCYYGFIEWALANGVTRFEAGAQGEHKIQRGFLPVVTHSAHWLRHDGLARAVAQFIDAEAAETERVCGILAEHSPYRADGATGSDVA